MTAKIYDFEKEKADKEKELKEEVRKAIIAQLCKQAEEQNW